LAVADPKSAPSQPPPPAVKIEKVLVDHRPCAGWAEAGNELRLPPTTHSIDIHYSVVRLGRPERIQFQHRLHQEGAWEDAGQDRAAPFYDLRPGPYHFAVRASDNDDRWGTPAGLAFVVQPYYWQTSWFRAVVLLAAAGLMGSAYRWRVAGLEKRRQQQADFSRRLIESQETDRKRLAKELHDGLGQNLIIIKNRAQLGLQRLSSSPPVAEQLREISEAATHALEDVRTAARALHPYELERLGLSQALEAMAQRASESSPTQFKVDLDDVGGLFPSETQINLYRILQEGVNNILKHARAREVILEVKREDGIVRAALLDDGCGFDAAAGRPGFGLQGMAERARLIGGSLRIQSAPGRGTRLEITVPCLNSPHGHQPPHPRLHS